MVLVIMAIIVSIDTVTIQMYLFTIIGQPTIIIMATIKDPDIIIMGITTTSTQCLCFT